MTLEALYKDLNELAALRESRQNKANSILNDLDLFPKILQILYMVNDKTSCKAAWVFELVCVQNSHVLIPYLDEFTAHLNKIHLDAAVRPVSKVCHIMAQAYYSKKPNQFQKALTKTHKELIIEACFDWMITEHKVAAKVFAMKTLFLFGSDFKWIHYELTLLLERDFHLQSAGYKSCAKHLLKKLKNA